MKEEVKWTVYDPANSVQIESNAKKLPFVSTWANFISKLPEDEQAKVFNAMRGALIQHGLMENSK